MSTLDSYRLSIAAAHGVTQETIVTPESLPEWEKAQARKCGHVQVPDLHCRVCRDTQIVSDMVWATGNAVRVFPCK